jgi:hypothetical protein
MCLICSWKGICKLNYRRASASASVAKWCIFKPIMTVWVNFEVPCNERYWYILWSFWYILRSFWYILLSFWYIFFRFGMLYQEKSGNPGRHTDPSFDKTGFLLCRNVTKSAAIFANCSVQKLHNFSVTCRVGLPNNVNICLNLLFICS